MSAQVNIGKTIKIGCWTATPALNLLENGERSIKIEPRTMDVLIYLAGRARDVVSVEELLKVVWRGVVVADSSVYVAIKQLRQALAVPGDHTPYIETIPKRGYRLVAPVDEVPPTTSPTPVPGGSPPMPLSKAIRRLNLTSRLAIAAVFALTAIILVAQLTMRALDAGAFGDPPAESGATDLSATVRFELPTGATWGAAVSPDGRYIAYAAGPTSETALLFVRPIDSREARALSGTEGAARPFWSPDGQQIGFVSHGLVKRIALSGGPPQTLASTPVASGGSWSPNGIILFDGGSGIERVHASGGSQSKVTELLQGELAHAAPVFFPDGRRFFFTSAFGTPGVYVGTLDSPERTRVLPESAIVAYASGHLLFNRGATLVAQRFDPERLTLYGEPVPIAEGLGVDASGVFGFFSASDAGVIVYETVWQRSWRSDVERTELVWYDRNGQRLGTVGEPRAYRGIALSPDGRHLAVHTHVEPGGGNLWLFDQERDTFMRLTSGAAHDMFPVWSPDGSLVLFTGPNFNLHLQERASGPGSAKLVFDGLRFAFPTDWSSDGAIVLVTHAPGNGHRFDVSAVPLNGERVPLSLLSSPFNESAARFSPDKRWIAYVSDESGRSEVYVRSFPEATGRWQASTAGGYAPRWSGDGRELFYLAPDGTIVAVPVQLAETGESGLSLGTPHALFRADVLFDNHSSAVGELGYEPYGVSANGERFLVNERINGSGQAAEIRNADAPRGSVAVIVHWTAALER